MRESRFVGAGRFKTMLVLTRAKEERSAAEWDEIFTFMDKNQKKPNYLALTRAKWPGMTKAGLRYRWKNRILGPTKPGSKPKLTEEGEEAFVEYIKAQQASLTVSR